MSEHGKDSDGLNHGPGSFAHNNQDRLSGGKTQVQESAPEFRDEFNRSRDPLIARQMLDEGKTESQRRQAEITKASRTRHAPTTTPALRPNLPNSAAVDRESFNVRQRLEASAAQGDQNTAVAQSRAGQLPQTQSPSLSSRFWKADNQGQRRLRYRSR